MPPVEGAEAKWSAFLPLLLLGTAAVLLLAAWHYSGFLTGDDLEIVESAAAGLYASDLDAELEDGLRDSGFRRCATFQPLRSQTVVLYFPDASPCPER